VAQATHHPTQNLLEINLETKSVMNSMQDALKLMKQALVDFVTHFWRCEHHATSMRTAPYGIR
jgi:hypothetical protein